MSDSHSPSRRSAHLVDPAFLPYPPTATDGRRLDSFHPPPVPPYYDQRPVTSVHHHSRPLYPGEAAREQPQHFPMPGATVDPAQHGSMGYHTAYPYAYAPVPPPGYSSGQAGAPHAQQTAAIAPQPMRAPTKARRQKQHVASACINCKKAHLSCDVQRPCGRCVNAKKQDTCKDVQHKKRGRPRLKDDKEGLSSFFSGKQPPAQILSAPPAPAHPSEGFAQEISFPLVHRASESLHSATSSRTRGSVSGLSSRPSTHGGDGQQPNVSGFVGVSPSPYTVTPGLSNHQLPVAYLSLDFVVMKSNSAFRDLVAVSGDIRGKALKELLESDSFESLNRLQSELRDERGQRDPSYLPPITPVEQDPLQMVSENDVDQVSQGFSERHTTLHFRLPGGAGHHYLKCLIRLAKTSLYFVTLVVYTPPRAAAPPLQTQHLAPPTPACYSHSLSAPTTSAPKDFASYAVPSSFSAGSAPNSPYFNFANVRTSLPAVGASTWGVSPSPSSNYASPSGHELGYFELRKPPPQRSQGTTYPSPYPPLSRNDSITSESSLRREYNASSDGAARREALQLPPIRTAAANPYGGPTFDAVRETSRLRESVSSSERPETPDKRRRLNIHEVLE
ncbi:hypothetical protein M011DRAFT_481081 [Sporormia fimetaria CBS 119925]|uniref:Zn(2)-C6 fungal-type domain-containing protein n=1 Tax=Sporormia fimetaria CBS 119925 TaxID=1340428 RepID=A0A6A6V066_9PLEO|nr:hypothetical protein M011DRAFT_481081 [Sporormia fimetaria CBS 119925]